MLICVYSLQQITTFQQFVSVRKASDCVLASVLDTMVAKVPFSKRWIKPEIYPLFLAIGAALGICGFTMARNLTINPDVRIVKEDREAGVLENYKEGETYKNHGLRKYLATQEPQIMPTINNHFSGAKSH